MKAKFLLTTIAAVLFVGTSFADPIHDVAWKGDFAGVQRELNKGSDVNAKDESGLTPLDVAEDRPEITDLLRKHGGKTGEELKAAGK